MEFGLNPSQEITPESNIISFLRLKSLKKTKMVHRICCKFCPAWMMLVPLIILPVVTVFGTSVFGTSVVGTRINSSEPKMNPISPGPGAPGSKLAEEIFVKAWNSKQESRRRKVEEEKEGKFRVEAKLEKEGPMEEVPMVYFFFSFRKSVGFVFSKRARYSVLQ